MYTLKVDGVSYGVRFQYRPVNLLEGERGGEYFAEVDTSLAEREGHDSTRTVCQILILDDEKRTSELVCEGDATCSLADNFRKTEGRKRSLTKALVEFTKDDFNKVFTRKLRKAFWTAYFRNHKDLRPKKTCGCAGPARA
jgi:hypothetical protein